MTTAFDLTRQHAIGPTGLAPGGPERAEIHKLHRLVVVLASRLVIIAGVLALRAKIGATAIVVAYFSVGVAAILSDLPIGVAIAHNWLAAMLLPGLLRLLWECRNRQALL